MATAIPAFEKISDETEATALTAWTKAVEWSTLLKIGVLAGVTTASARVELPPTNLDYPDVRESITQPAAVEPFDFLTDNLSLQATGTVNVRTVRSQLPAPDWDL